MRTCSVLATALMLSGCSLFQSVPQLAMLPQRPAIPANLTTPCPMLTPLADGSGASVLRKLVEVAEEYADCRRRHDALIEAVKP